MAPKVDWQELSREVSVDRRDGKRVAIRRAISVTGISASGDAYSYETNTRNISEEGCCFESARPLEVGEIVAISVVDRPADGEHRFQVVRVEQDGVAWVVGARLVQSTNIWGVVFPPKHRLRKSSG